MSKARPLIAILDDEESVRRALSRLLASSGLEVASYSSGTEFFASLKAHRPDCLILDLHMPGMTGFEVQARLSQTGDQLPVVTITGHDTPETRDRTVAAGALAYLPKPIDEEILLETLKGLMRLPSRNA